MWQALRQSLRLHSHMGQLTQKKKTWSEMVEFGLRWVSLFMGQLLEDAAYILHNSHC